MTDHPPWPPETETEQVLDGTTHPTGTAPDGVPAVGDPAADAAPVFVDVTGARHRRTRALLLVASVLCLGFLGLVVVGLTGSGPLSGSPILTPVRGALDHLGVPRPAPSVTDSGGTTSPSVSSSSPDASATAGPSQPTSGGAAVPGPSATTRPTPQPTGARPTPTSAVPSASPTPSNPGATRRATPTPSTGSTHRATPTPKASRTP